MKREMRRCAVYTRKSSEEGLEQDFNSLDAQREACSAYIASQAGEGWRPIKGRFDDGGFSGGTMERPGLHRLLAAVDAGEIDVIVVYKVDRLTRSLSDFARIVERLDAKGVSFVSVTQAFNTTTSMGRLTLNVLLSFAQFEREVTGERIRDKIAASKSKGMWMGGTVPLGYTPNGRTLAIEEDEAETVRFIFQRYLELGSVHTLQVDLEARGIRSKRWTSRKGRVMGGAPLARGALYHLLRNRLYLGEITHGDKHYPGLHPAIIDASLFEAVQKQLQAAQHVRVERPFQTGGSPLTGLLFDANGAPMSPTHARGKSGNPHRYYVSKSLLIGQREKAPKLARIPALALEDVVADRLSLVSSLTAFEWRDVARLVERATLHADHLALTMAPITEDAVAALREQAPEHDTLDRDQNGRCIWSIPLTLKRRGGAVRVLDPSGRRVVNNSGPDPAIVKALARAHRYRALLTNGAYSTGTDLARAEGLTKAMVYRTLKLAYLAPDLTRDFLHGQQRPGLTVAQLYTMDLPAEWSAQRRLVGRGQASES